MRLTIHRGTHQIGGSCIELSSGRTRLILDVGLPLDADPEILLRSPTAYRPAVEGLFGDAKAKPLADAVLLSHFHPDHSRFLTDVHPDIPIYMSEGSRLVMDALGMFLSKRLLNKNVHVLGGPEPAPVKIGDFTVEAIPVDHSAPASLAFLIRAEGKTFLYTGDFRAHGRQTRLFDDLIARAGKGVDALLVEGTMVGSHRTPALARSEAELEENLAARIRAAADGPILANFSPTNLDRVISFREACRKTNTELVVDLFTACLCDRFTRSRPDAALKGAPIRVLYFRGHAKALEAAGHRDFLVKMKERKIEFGELAKGKRVILFRPSHLRNYIRKNIFFTKAPFLNSQYEGVYPGQEEMVANFNAYLADNGIKKVQVHTSGHAFEADLKRFVDGISPKNVIPIHTCHPGEYVNLFPDHTVRQLKDGEAFEF